MAMKIAVVDDNQTNLMIIEKILRKAGYNRLVLLTSAKELYQCLQLDEANAEEVQFDLILMDLMMPEIDGMEACRTVLADERYSDLPIIFVTAMGDSNKMAEAMDAGALDYVMKPINKVELLARIRSVLRLKQEKDLRKERDKRLQYELDLAKQVQGSILSDPIEEEDITISAIYKPSFELAGDLYAWYPISEHRYGVILLDMMGHGISSSLVCMYIYSALKDTITGMSDPEKVMKELNRRMYQLQMPDHLINYYFTAIYLVLDTEMQTIEYVNAGHPAGIAIVDDEVKLLTDGCCALGFFEDIDVIKGVIPYKRGARTLLFTDGLSEWLEQDYEDAIARLISTLQEKDMDNPDSFLHQLQPSMEPHNAPKDDLCLVMISTNV
ncbi:fused response regulator/phosphatase [Neobacillus sp. SuZ13]|uniref:PP2C family protein-serine/threonine phosphatase n=1 Tax=Neobacillus sp. SuZ13 TaxID=3047875 RepID=UPI0024BF72C9|nr:fused response regulator/phosphatase [Neobacillus sp. SuZ13]WHY66929.1 fused response regulator/phosphatase [Neobacillus sp. SuZ13]